MFFIETVVLAASLPLGAQPTIVEQAVEADQLSTLVTAVKAAGLVEALSADGPVTVFAPTNEAFARVDSKVIEYLLSEPGRPELGRILLHHVVPGRLDAATLVGTSEVTTLAGTTLSLETARDRLLVDDAVVQAADIGASNGVIHTIDRVMIPPVQQSPLEILLVNAIERGVPLFNSNNPAGCAAVYATALEAAVSVDDFGLDKMVRDAITDRLREIAQERDATEQAWAYRRIMDALLSERMEVDARAPVDRVLFDFQDPGSVDVFDIVLDGVMGGRSSGRIRAGDGTLIFDGETSLRNNGGFSSMRAPVPSGSCDGADALRVRFKGDGRTWIIGTRSGRSFGGESYWTRFDTVNNRWMDVVIPIAEMERTSFGQALRGRIAPEQVRGIEFYMYDKKAGPFRLEIDSIEAISTGDTGDQA
ncbi:MAG: CIA30 family protein [Phycisphaerales bacterium]|nr:CIA30 family protein [Phycisphaerales bacterium]